MSPARSMWDPAACSYASCLIAVLLQLPHPRSVGLMFTKIKHFREGWRRVASEEGTLNPAV